MTSSKRFEIIISPEENPKLKEIYDTLLLAGYFRIKVPTINTFDKILGGITWCIICSNFEIEVEYNDDMNIGQKIRLSEKICQALKEMGCPYNITPFQIQGMDLDKIFPVLKWLIKFVYETREIRQEFNRSTTFLIGKKIYKELNDKHLRSEYTIKQTQNLFFNSRDQRSTRNYKQKGIDKQDPINVYSTLIEFGDVTANKTYNKLSALLSGKIQLDNKDRKQNVKQNQISLKRNLTEKIQDNIPFTNLSPQPVNTKAIQPEINIGALLFHVSPSVQSINAAPFEPSQVSPDSHQTGPSRTTNLLQNAQSRTETPQSPIDTSAAKTNQSTTSFQQNQSSKSPQLQTQSSASSKQITQQNNQPAQQISQPIQQQTQSAQQSTQSIQQSKTSTSPAKQPPKPIQRVQNQQASTEIFENQSQETSFANQSVLTTQTENLEFQQQEQFEQYEQLEQQKPAIDIHEIKKDLILEVEEQAQFQKVSKTQIKSEIVLKRVIEIQQEIIQDLQEEDEEEEDPSIEIANIARAEKEFHRNQILTLQVKRQKYEVKANEVITELQETKKEFASVEEETKQNELVRETLEERAKINENKIKVLKSQRQKQVEEIKKRIDNKNQLLDQRKKLKKQINSENQELIKQKEKAQNDVPVIDENVYQQFEKDNEKKKAKYDEIFAQYALSNQEIALLQRQVQNFPTATEVAQYHQRFLELFETINIENEKYRDYYMKFNNFQDIKTQMNQFVDIMRVFNENYEINKRSRRGKENFINELTQTFRQLQDNLKKVNDLLGKSKITLESKNESYLIYTQIERDYYKFLKDLNLEYEKNDFLLQQYALRQQQ